MLLIIFTSILSLLGGILVIAEIERRGFRHPAHQPVSDYYSNLARPILAVVNTWIKLTHQQQPFHQTSDFPEHELFEKHAEAIRQEALHAYEALGDEIPRFHEIDSMQEKISDAKWKTLVIKWYSDKLVERNAKHMPVLASLLQQCPEVKLAMLSVLEPHAYIPPHYGPSKVCDRYYCLYL